MKIRGFSFTELLILIAIVIVLAAMIAPAYTFALASPPMVTAIATASRYGPVSFTSTKPDPAEHNPDYIIFATTSASARYYIG